MKVYFDNDSDAESRTSAPKHNLEISDDPTTESEEEM